MTNHSLIQQTEQVLEWQQLLDAVANEAASGMGTERCRVLEFAPGLEAARMQQQETFEMLQSFELTSSLPTLNFPDIRPLLARVAKGGFLEGLDLRDISVVSTISQHAKQWLDGHQETYPTIWKRFAQFQDLSLVRQTIDHCIDAQGHLRESASPLLNELTQKSQNLRQAMRRRLEQLLAAQQYEEQLQGPVFC